jgi:hypothetical protein
VRGLLRTRPRGVPALRGTLPRGGPALRGTLPRGVPALRGTLPRGVPALRGTLPRGVPAAPVPDALCAPVARLVGGQDPLAAKGSGHDVVFGMPMVALPLS